MSNYSNNTDVSPVKVASVVVTPTADNNKFMAGAVVGVSPAQTTIPQLTATAFDLNGNPVAGQSFRWESSNPCICAVDQSGNCTRVTNNQCQSFDSSGASSGGSQDLESNIGGIAVITATWIRQDGSLSGVSGTIKCAVQAQGFRYIAPGSPQSVINPIRNIVILDNVSNAADVVNYNNDGGYLATYPNSNDN